MIVSKYKLHVSIEEVEIILDINVLLLIFFIFICLYRSNIEFHLHVAFVSIDNINESRPQCLTFDRYFQ